MDYVSMKMSIYENYANGKLTQENARQLIDVLNNNYGNTLVQEMVDAENEFMMNSVNVAYESAGVDALYEASETFGQKVAKIWENFKKWIKGIIDAILGRKKEVPDKSKVTVKKGLPKAMDDLLTQVKKLKSAKGVAAIGAAVAGVIGATAAVKKLKGKPAEGEATEETDAAALTKKQKTLLHLQQQHRKWHRRRLLLHKMQPRLFLLKTHLRNKKQQTRNLRLRKSRRSLLLQSEN